MDQIAPKPGAYRHYKGGLYMVLATGRHSETEEWLVIYRSDHDGSTWVRPLDMWNQQVLVDDVWMPRFARIEGGHGIG